MGSSLSCGCDRQPCFATPECATSHYATPAPATATASAAAQAPVPPFRFYAELFQLSTDYSQWILLYPRLLSISIFELSSRRPSILFFASSRSHLVFHQVIDLPSEVKRASPCFAYWRCNGDIFGVNIVRSKDCDRFCELFIAPCAQMQPSKHFSTSTDSDGVSSGAASQSFTVDNTVVKHSKSPSARCIVEMQLKQTSVQIGDSTLAVDLAKATIEIDPEKRCSVCNRPQEVRIVKSAANSENEEGGLSLEVCADLPSCSTAKPKIPRIEINPETKGEDGAEESMKVPSKEKVPHVKPPLRMHRSAHGHLGVETDDHDLSARPSTSWQHPLLCQERRAKSTERPHRHQEPEDNKLWSAPLRCVNHRLAKRDPGLLSHLAFEKLNNKDDRRKSMPNAFYQISHFSDVARGHLISSICELVNTEELYVKHLEKLITQYLRPSNLPILELTEHLLRVQTSFLTSLLDAAGDTVNSTDVSEQQLRDALIRIFALFVNKCSKFKIYSEYSAAFLRFQQERKEKWKTIWELEKMNSSKEQSEGVQSLLIKPIQRVLKYPLFLQQMRDNCAKGCVERQQGEQALQRMQALAEYINEMQRLIEQYGKEIEDIAAKNPAAPSMKFSQLLMFAHIDWLNCSESRSGAVVSCVAFVFSSVVLILCSNLTKNKGKSYRILPVAEVEVTESCDDAAECRYLFTVSQTTSLHNQHFRFCCCQSEVKTQFIKAIQKALTLTKKDQRRPLSGSSQSDGGYGSERHQT